MNHQTIGAYSDLDLLGYEEAFLTAEKQNYLSRFLYDRRRIGTETLKISIPARSYIRLEVLLEYLPTDYKLEISAISNIFDMLIENTLGQYGKEITPKNVFSTIRGMERRAKLKDNGETTVLTYDNQKRSKVKVKIEYKRR